MNKYVLVRGFARLGLFLRKYDLVYSKDLCLFNISSLIPIHENCRLNIMNRMI